MSYSLAAALRRRKENGASVPRSIKIATFEPTNALYTEHKQTTLEPVRLWRQMIEQAIFPAYDSALARLGIVQDDTTDDLKTGLEASYDQVYRLVLSLTPRLSGWLLRFEEWHRAKFARATSEASGVDVFPFIDEEVTKPTIEAALAENASLIRGLNDDMRKRVETLVWQAFKQKQPRRDLAKALDEAIGFGKSRALLIARDQTVKIAADLDRVRQEEAGIDSYIWRTSRDDRVRPNHRSKEGRVFQWSKPPADTGHPGHDINCRCKAQAYIPELDE